MEVYQRERDGVPIDHKAVQKRVSWRSEIERGSVQRSRERSERAHLVMMMSALLTAKGRASMRVASGVQESAHLEVK